MITHLSIRAAAGARERPQPLSRLRREFPTVRIGEDVPAHLPRTRVSCGRWRSEPLDLQAFDRHLDAVAQQGAFAIEIVDARGGAVDIAEEVLTRAQRLIDRRNAYSAGPLLERVLDRHRELHDLDKPLVRADYEHAMDAWQWLLRIEPGSSRAAQIAMLFHDVERLVSEPDERVEHRAKDYEAFKDAHASLGGELARGALQRLGLESAELERIVDLVATHERPGSDPERARINDADALSFFSKNSSGFLRYFGPDHTRRKVRYTLARLSPLHRWRLRHMLLDAAVAAMVRDEIAGAGYPDAPRGGVVVPLSRMPA